MLPIMGVLIECDDDVLAVYEVAEQASSVCLFNHASIASS
jgi:hypothetical protein